MKRFLCLLTSLMLIISVITACSQHNATENEGVDPVSTSNRNESSEDSTSSTEEVTISLWYLTDEGVKAIAEEYMQGNEGVKIDVTFNSTDDHKKNLKIAASSKTLPDMWRNWGGSLGSYYPENGLSYDLTEYAKKNNWDEKFIPAALELATLGGQLSGYPFVINGLGIFYRKDIFEQYGLEIPQTFEEMENVMKTLKENGITPISTAGKYGWHVMRILELLIEMYCGSETHDKLLTLEADWSQEGVVKAFTKFKEWIDNGYFPEGYLSTDPNDTKLLLYSDMAAMDIQGPWYETNIIDDGQDVSKYGYFKLPLVEGANRMSAFIEMIQFNAELPDDKLEACMDFVEYLYTPERVAEYNLQQPLPYKDLELPEHLALVPQLMDSMDKYGTFTIADQGLPQEVVNKLFEVQDNLAIGAMTPEEAAQFMEQEAQKYKDSQK